MKRLTIGVAAGMLVVLAMAAVVGVGTARAAETETSKTYCVDGQTTTTTDPGIQEIADEAISEYGGTITTATIVYDEESTPDGGGTLFDVLASDSDNDFAGYGVWTRNDILEWLDDDDVEDVTNVVVHHLAAGACAAAGAYVAPPAREAYCSVAGNTWPDGTPIPAGTFLNLLAGQASTDKHYTGGVPAWYVQGVGLTCTLTPAQAALAAASTLRAGAAGDIETPIPGVPDYAIYPFVPAK